MQAAAMRTVLALATFGGATKNINEPIYVVPPKVAKASTVVTVVWLLRVAVADSFANKLCQCKWSITNYKSAANNLAIMALVNMIARGTHILLDIQCIIMMSLK